MGRAETKRILGNPYKGVKGVERRTPRNNGSIRNVAPKFSEGQMVAMKPSIDLIKKTTINEHVQRAVDDATAIIGLHRDAMNVVGAMNGSNRQQEVIDELMDKISDAAEKAVLAADAVQQVASQTQDIENAYNTSIEAIRTTEQCRDAARQAFLELQAIQERLAAQNKGASVVANLVKMGVDEWIAQDLRRSDWDVAEAAITTAREIAAAKGDLSYDDIACAIKDAFERRGYDVEAIFSARKYIYDRGIPYVENITGEIEDELKISFTVINNVDGRGILYHLRRLKLLAMIWWLCWHPDYLWRSWQKNTLQQDKVLAEEVAPA